MMQKDLTFLLHRYDHTCYRLSSYLHDVYMSYTMSDLSDHERNIMLFLSRLLRRGLFIIPLLLLAMMAGTIPFQLPTAHAASTLTVTTTADLSTCTTTLSLRCAINQANKDGSGDTIAFNIPHTDPGCAGSVCT